MYILAEEKIHAEVFQCNYNNSLTEYLNYEHTLKLLKYKYYMRTCSTYTHIKTAWYIKYKKL